MHTGSVCAVQYLVASDLHYGLQQFDWIAEQASGFDAVILAGDHLDVVGRVDLNAQIALVLAFLGRLADTTTVIANSGNHDLNERRPDGEKSATWLSDADPRVVTDGATTLIGDDLVSACCWWEGPHTRAELERQLAAAAERRAGRQWIWVYHSPPDDSPTSRSGKRHFGDPVLNELIAEHHPDLVLTGHVHEAPFQPDGSFHDLIGTTLVVNAGRQPGPVPAHLIVDTDAHSVDWWTFADSGTATW